MLWHNLTLGSSARQELRHWGMMWKGEQRKYHFYQLFMKLICLVQLSIAKTNLLKNRTPSTSPLKPISWNHTIPWQESMIYCSRSYQSYVSHCISVIKIWQFFLSLSLCHPFVHLNLIPLVEALTMLKYSELFVNWIYTYLPTTFVTFAMHLSILQENNLLIHCRLSAWEKRQRKIHKWHLSSRYDFSLCKANRIISCYWHWASWKCDLQQGT